MPSRKVVRWRGKRKAHRRRLERNRKDASADDKSYTSDATKKVDTLLILQVSGSMCWTSQGGGSGITINGNGE